MRARWTGPRGFEGGSQRDPPCTRVHSAVSVPTREFNEEVRILVYNRIATERGEGRGGEEPARAVQEPLEVEKEAGCPEMRGIEQQGQTRIWSPVQLR